MTVAAMARPPGMPSLIEKLSIMLRTTASMILSPLKPNELITNIPRMAPKKDPPTCLKVSRTVSEIFVLIAVRLIIAAIVGLTKSLKAVAKLYAESALRLAKNTIRKEYALYILPIILLNLSFI
jgi:hypothetical protein